MLLESFSSTWRGSAASSLLSHSPILHHDAIASSADRHVITLPPFLPNDDSHGPYPTPLHKIHVVPLLSPEETTHILHLAQTHAADTESWDRQDSTRHVNYNTVDFAIDDSQELVRYLGDDGIRFHDRIFRELSQAFQVDAEDLSYLDLFCASYEGSSSAEAGDDDQDEREGRNTMDRLDFHRDGSLLSFTVLLNPPDEFRGGGTVFDALRDISTMSDDHEKQYSSLLSPEGAICPPQAGYATLHCGKLLHGGHVVTEGRRIVLVGFVDVDERNVKEGALGKAAKEWGRNDVRLFWEKRRLDLWKRQQEQSNAEEEEDGRKNARGAHRHPKWVLRNENFVSKSGRSCLGPGFVIPSTILDRMEARANDERIRQRRLKTEDALLREILLPRELRGDKIIEGEWREVEYDEDGVPMGIEIVD